MKSLRLFISIVLFLHFACSSPVQQVRNKQDTSKVTVDTFKVETKAKEIDKKIQEAASATQGSLGEFEKENILIQENLKKLQEDLTTQDAAQNKNIADNISKLATDLNVTGVAQKEALLKQIADLEGKVTQADVNQKADLLAQIDALKVNLHAANELNAAMQSKLDLLANAAEELKKIDTTTNTINTTQTNDITALRAQVASDIAALTKKNEDMQKQINSLIDESLPIGSVAFVDSTLTGSVVPPGWVDCSSKYARKFLIVEDVGSDGNNFRIGNTGGAESVTLSNDHMPSHSHTISPVGGHQHVYGDVFFQGDNDQLKADGKGGINTGSHWGAAGRTDDNYWGRQYTRYTEEAGGHTHTIGSTGGGQAFKILPPYVAMRLICKTK